MRRKNLKNTAFHIYPTMKRLGEIFKEFKPNPTIARSTAFPPRRQKRHVM